MTRIIYIFVICLCITIVNRHRREAGRLAYMRDLLHDSISHEIVNSRHYFMTGGIINTKLTLQEFRESVTSLTKLCAYLFSIIRLLGKFVAALT